MFSLFNRDIEPPDWRLLDLADWLVRKWQAATGVPMWTVEVNMWCCLAVLGIIPMLPELRSHWFAAAFVFGVALLQIAAWSALSPLLRRRQQLADDLNAPLPSSTRNTILGLLQRGLFLFNAVAVALMPPSKHPTEWVKGALWIALAYINGAHTWPNNGPRLKDRLKSLAQAMHLRPVRVSA